MAVPVFQSAIKATDFDLFLDEIGLEDLDARGRIELVDKAIQAVEYRLVTNLLDRLSTDKKIELVDLMREADKTGNEGPVNDFYAREIPDVESIVDEAIDEVKSRLRASTASMKDSFAMYMSALGLDSAAPSEPEQAQESDNSAMPEPLPIPIAEPASQTLPSPLPEPVPSQAPIDPLESYNPPPELIQDVISDDADSSQAITDELKAISD